MLVVMFELLSPVLCTPNKDWEYTSKSNQLITFSDFFLVFALHTYGEPRQQLAAEKGGNHHIRVLNNLQSSNFPVKLTNYSRVSTISE